MRNKNKHRHAGYMIERCRWNFSERVFAEEWMKENHRRPGVNYGYGILQDLFGMRVGILGWIKWRLIIKPRDEYIVATIIQWLGTNIGMGFLERCLKRIGYKLVETDEYQSRRFDYHYPFDPSKVDDASAWYNLAIQARPIFSEDQKRSPLPFRPRTVKSKPRQHIIRRMPGPQGYLESAHPTQKYCIRCKWFVWREFSFMYSKEAPECSIIPYENGGPKC